MGRRTMSLYKVQLKSIVETMRRSYAGGRPVEINILTDLWHLTGMCNCGAGEENLTIAPNGRVYICPAFYYHNPDDHVGTLDTGIHLKNSHLLKAANSLFCSSCDVYSCRRCKFLNKLLTGEIGVPSRIQCLVSHLERTMSMKLQRMLLDEGLIDPVNVIRPVSHADPLELVVMKTRTRG